LKKEEGIVDEKGDAWRGRRQVLEAGTPALGDDHPALP